MRSAPLIYTTHSRKINQSISPAQRLSGVKKNQSYSNGSKYYRALGPINIAHFRFPGATPRPSLFGSPRRPSATQLPPSAPQPGLYRQRGWFSTGGDVDDATALFRCWCCATPRGDQVEWARRGLRCLGCFSTGDCGLIWLMGGRCAGFEVVGEEDVGGKRWWRLWIALGSDLCIEMRPWICVEDADIIDIGDLKREGGGDYMICETDFGQTLEIVFWFPMMTDERKRIFWSPGTPLAKNGMKVNQQC